MFPNFIQQNPKRVLSILVISLLISFNLLFSIIGLSIFILLFYIYFLSYLGNKTQQIKVKKISKFYIFFIVWLIYAAIQAILEGITDKTLFHVQVLFYGLVLIWFMSRIIDTKEWLDILYKMWGFSVFCTIILGWWELTTGNHIFHYDTKFQEFVTINFFNPNNYCFFLVVSLPVVLYWIKLGVVYRLFGIFMFISTFYFAYHNGSRLIMLITIVIMCLFLISLAKSKKKLLLLLIILISVSVFNYYELILDSLSEISTMNNSDNSINVRSSLNESALQIFNTHPFGVGPGKLELYMPRIGSNVHNFWLETLVNYGIIIFLAIVLFFGFFIFRLFSFRKSEEFRNIIMPIFWSVIIFIPTSTVPSSIFILNITWFLFGVMICTTNVISRERLKVLKKSEGR